MKKNIVAAVLVTLCFAVTAVASVPKPASDSRSAAMQHSTSRRSTGYVESIAPEAVFKAFKALDETRSLVPPVFGGPSSAPNLAVANCFGLKLPNGTRVMAESSGRDYGLTFGYAGEAQKTAIGLLRVEGPVLLGDKPLSPGSYIVFVAPDSVSLMASSSTGGTSLESFTLDSKLDAVSLQPKAPQRLRFSLVGEGSRAFLMIGENRLSIRDK